MPYLFATLSLAILAVLSSSSDFKTPEAAFTDIERVNVFAFGGVGYAGRTSEGEANLRIVLSLSREQAVAKLEELYAHGSLEAKCYALAGLHKLDPSKFATHIRFSQVSTAEIYTMSGCLLESEKYKDIIKRISNGEFDAFVHP